MESTIQHLRTPPEKAAMPATDVRIKVTLFEEADPPSLGTENKKTTVDEQLTETPLKKEVRTLYYWTVYSRKKVWGCSQKVLVTEKVIINAEGI